MLSKFSIFFFHSCTLLKSSFLSLNTSTPNLSAKSGIFTENLITSLSTSLPLL
ncbi:hypothetical protein A0H76_3068 [Hepatospora eriocheir]|uniref:Uncharacterized protein n=1 Tax=Hepatospora eriocheir TaxID=1081669 RepID=A0A1X0Q5Y2_9MICR|nr:hypothetical protein A0H76_3068 [Hepatospora eriocheir]